MKERKHFNSSSVSIINASKHYVEIEQIIFEMVKNAADANASKVIFIFDEPKKEIVIKNNGKPFNKNDLDLISVIHDSDKNEGTIKTFQNGDKVIKRIITGSQGEGFYSIFNFGFELTILSSEWIKNNVLESEYFDLNEHKHLNVLTEMSFEPKEHIDEEYDKMIQYFENDEYNTVFIIKEKNIESKFDKIWDDIQNIKMITESPTNVHFKRVTNQGNFDDSSEQNNLKILPINEIIEKLSNLDLDLEFVYSADEDKGQFIINKSNYIKQSSTINLPQLSKNKKLFRDKFKNLTGTFRFRLIKPKEPANIDDSFKEPINNFLVNMMINNGFVVHTNYKKTKGSFDFLPKTYGMTKYNTLFFTSFSNTSLTFDSGRTKIFDGLDNSFSEYNNLLTCVKDYFKLFFKKRLTEHTTKNTSLKKEKIYKSIIENTNQKKYEKYKNEWLKIGEFLMKSFKDNNKKISHIKNFTQLVNEIWIFTNYNNDVFATFIISIHANVRILLENIFIAKLSEIIEKKSQSNEGIRNQQLWELLNLPFIRIEELKKRKGLDFSNFNSIGSMILAVKKFNKIEKDKEIVKVVDVIPKVERSHEIYHEKIFSFNKIDTVLEETLIPIELFEICKEVNDTFKNNSFYLLDEDQNIWNYAENIKTINRFIHTIKDEFILEQAKMRNMIEDFVRWLIIE